MGGEWFLRIFLFSVVHWVLVWFMIQDLISREKILGGRKPPWAIIIIFVPCFGSLIYLLCHPQIFNPDSDKK